MNTEKVMRELGINGTYLGFHYLVDAVNFVNEDENYLISLCSRLYPAIAKRHRTSPENVERNIRTVIAVCWKRGNRSRLNKMFGHTLRQKPSSGEFIDALYAYSKMSD